MLVFHPNAAEIVSLPDRCCVKNEETNVFLMIYAEAICIQ